MGEIRDERGFNQIFTDSHAAKIRKQRRCDYMIRNMNLKSDSFILEIGCGTGEGLEYIQKKTNTNCLGIDLSEMFIQQANRKFKTDKLRFETTDFCSAESFKGTMSYGAFDYVIGNGILHHLYYSLDNSLSSIYQLLKPKGKIIFIEPNIYNPYIALIFNIPYLRKKAFLEPDEMAFSDRFIKRKLEAAKFIKCKTEIKDFLLPNTPNKLIQTVVKLGEILEQTPFKIVAQSIFIVAEK